jgi:hypothetical protein
MLAPASAVGGVAEVKIGAIARIKRAANSFIEIPHWGKFWVTH